MALATALSRGKCIGVYVPEMAAAEEVCLLRCVHV
jgi:hypothetical protein